jgi:hypothetical protein
MALTKSTKRVELSSSRQKKSGSFGSVCPVSQREMAKRLNPVRRANSTMDVFPRISSKSAAVALAVVKL